MHFRAQDSTKKKTCIFDTLIIGTLTEEQAEMPEYIAPWGEAIERNVAEIRDTAKDVKDDADRAEGALNALIEGIESGDFKGDKGDKGDTGQRGEKGDPLTWDDLTPEQRESLRGEKGDRGEHGVAGKKGDPGIDGFSPTVRADREADGVRITIADKDGTTSAVVKDGRIDKSLENRVDLLEEAADGTIIRHETVSGEAYVRDVPADSLKTARLKLVGANTEAVDGELISYEPHAVVSNAGQRIDLSALVQKYFPDGMKSAGDVYDEIDFERGVAVQRVGSRHGDLITINSANMPLLSQEVLSGELPKLNSTNVLDSFGSPTGRWGSGVIVGSVPAIYWSHINTREQAEAFVASMKNGLVYYELADPIETPIDPADLDGLTALNVEAGGSLTFVNQHGDDYHVDLPNTVEWTLKKQSGISDVQINGTSIVTDGVANVPMASTNRLGVVKSNANYGVNMTSDGSLHVEPTWAKATT